MNSGNPSGTSVSAFAAFHQTSDIRTNLDVFQNPVGVGFRNEFETQDTVLGQVHVCLENIRRPVMHFFAFKVRRERTDSRSRIAQRCIPIRRECALQSEYRRGWMTYRQHANIPKNRFQRLVENITQLVFKVLSRDQRVQ
jgi:hypothetical protein